MKRIMKIFKPTPTWEPSEIVNNWDCSDGRRICLQDDISICVSNLEDSIMRRFAIEKLSKHGIVIDLTPSSENVQPWQQTLRMCYPRRNSNDSGISIEMIKKTEEKVFNYPKMWINSNYRLHTPYFYINLLRVLISYGIDEPISIYRFPPNKIKQMTQQHKIRENRYLCEMFDILLMFLKQLPEGLLTLQFERAFLMAREVRKHSKRVAIMKLIAQAMPRSNREVFLVLMSYLRYVATTDERPLNASSLAIILRNLIFRDPMIDHSDRCKILETIVTKLENVFRLGAKTLNKIYKEIASKHPRQLCSLLERRIQQSYWAGSDIPQQLWILTNKRRSFEASNFASFHQNPMPGNANAFLNLSLADRQSQEKDEKEMKRLRKTLIFHIRQFPNNSVKKPNFDPKLTSVTEEPDETRQMYCVTHHESCTWDGIINDLTELSTPTGDLRFIDDTDELNK